MYINRLIALVYILTLTSLRTWQFIRFWARLLDQAINAFGRAFLFFFVPPDERPAYYDLADANKIPGRINTRMALVVLSSMAAVTLISAVYATMENPAFIVMIPMFALYTIFVLLRDQYRYISAA